MVWFGVQAGSTMMMFPKYKSRVIRWSIWAILTGALTALLCGAKQTDGWIPINKNLWYARRSYIILRLNNMSPFLGQ